MKIVYYIYYYHLVLLVLLLFIQIQSEFHIHINMGCQMCAERKEEMKKVKQNVRNPKQMKIIKRKRIVNRCSFNHSEEEKEFVINKQCSLMSKCNVLVKMKDEYDNYNDNEMKVKRRIPKTIIENGITYDNDELIDYDCNSWGIIFENTVDYIKCVNVTKETAVQMVRTTVKQNKYVEGQITKGVSDKQCEIIGNIIYEVVNGIKEYDISKPIIHPDLKYIRVRVSLNPLTDEYKKDNCYKDKDITNKEFFKAKRKVENGKEPNNIKVLSIQIC